MKNPFEFVVSAVRATGLDVANALPLVQSLRDLGMPLYGAQPPTGYADKADAWVNTGALLEPHELCGRADRRPDARRSADASRTNRRRAEEARRAPVRGRARRTTSASRPPRPWRKATTPAQAAALILGSPEFQKR